LSGEVYDQLIRHALDVRSAAGDLPKRKSDAAACIALTVLQLCQGNVQVKVGPLARGLHVDLHTLTRGFGNLGYAVAPKEIQIEIRNAAACRMLCADPSRKIDSIASELGYDDLSAFTKFFRMQNGSSPLEYRNDCRKHESPVMLHLDKR
jgi:AraC-like DNA-binding protein